jgi:mannose-6-phosphate isomerase-like protein (cupin superfamily)
MRAMTATVLEPGAGERLSAGGSSEIVIKAGSEETAGSLFLAETTIEPGFAGPPPHRHEVLHDMFYVLEGTLSVQLGDEIAPFGPGSFVCVPPGSVHTFSNPGEHPVRFLNFSTPGGFERYMRELGAAASAGPLDRETMGRIASRHDVEVV